MERLIKIMVENGVAEAGCIPYSECECVNPGLEKRIGFAPKSAAIGIIPYYTHHCDQKRTVSAYALAHDYHKLMAEVGERIIKEAKAVFPGSRFAFFCDHSPINEKQAAAKAGLGIIGQNSLLITPKYSSYVFIFDIISDIEFKESAHEVEYCENCGACKRACPSFLKNNGECLSAVTQKKGELTEEEERLISSNGYIWGCDICQEACPRTKTAKKAGTIYTDSPWFNYNIILSPTQESIDDSDDFSMRAYSWRGAKTIKRNIEILNKAKH